jgi:hypothetical protein
MVNDIVQLSEDSFLVAPNINKVNLLVNGQLTMLKTSDNFVPMVNGFLKCGDLRCEAGYLHIDR